MLIGMYTYARPGTVAMVDFDGGAAPSWKSASPQLLQAPDIELNEPKPRSCLPPLDPLTTTTRLAK